MGNNRLLKIIILLLTPLLLNPLSSSADLYQWTDKDGNTVFGDKPPENARNIKALEIKALEESGTRFATPSEIEDFNDKLESDDNTSLQSSTSQSDTQCRRYLRDLNKIELYLEHTYNQKDERKAKDLKELIKRECNGRNFHKKDNDYHCNRYRRELSKVEIYLEHTPNERDRIKAMDLRKQIKRECN